MGGVGGTEAYVITDEIHLLYQDGDLVILIVGEAIELEAPFKLTREFHVSGFRTDVCMDDSY